MACAAAGAAAFLAACGCLVASPCWGHASLSLNFILVPFSHWVFITAYLKASLDLSYVQHISALLNLIHDCWLQPLQLQRHPLCAFEGREPGCCGAICSRVRPRRTGPGSCWSTTLTVDRQRQLWSTPVVGPLPWRNGVRWAVADALLALLIAGACKLAIFFQLSCRQSVVGAVSGRRGMQNNRFNFLRYGRLRLLRDMPLSDGLRRWLHACWRSGQCHLGCVAKASILSRNSLV